MNKVTYQRPKNPECSIKMRMDFKTVLRKTCMRVKRGEGVQDKELYKCWIHWPIKHCCFDGELYKTTLASETGWFLTIGSANNSWMLMSPTETQEEFASQIRFGRPGMVFFSFSVRKSGVLLAQALYYVLLLQKPRVSAVPSLSWPILVAFFFFFLGILCYGILKTCFVAQIYGVNALWSLLK